MRLAWGGPWLDLLLVGAGGFAGSVSRYALGGWVHRLLPQAQFPWGTLAVNVAGCFLLGFLGGLTESRQILGPEARLFLFLGFLGGFTTFSTFGYETVLLLRGAAVIPALANVALHLGAAVGAAALGLALASAL
jgi:CrcB protein